MCKGNPYQCLNCFNKLRGWTFFRGRARAVIDYGMVNEETSDRVVEFRVGDRIDSHHQPLIVTMKEVKIVEWREGVICPI